MFTLSELNSKNYQILSTKNIEEENLLVVEVLHIKTKAKLLLFICDDENRVFNIAFKTPVQNGKGTPHILEHSVLCGSRKYNVKDPFVELAKGSLNTFLNAMTFPDKTCYPVASANLRDFHNLIDVYLDAVFFPNAIKNEKIFRQEGWHYELKDDNSLSVNGVVYNEMKGVYSDPDSILESAILENLYAGTNYAHDYGGNPSEIINLTFDEFVSFHDKFYSPSNSIIYLYGKLDFNEELEYLNKEYLSKFDYIDVDAKFTDARDFEENKEQISYYNIDTEDNSDKAYIAYSFSLNNEKTSLDNIVMQILDYVLFSSRSAIIKEKLLNEGIGKSIVSHLDTGLKNGMYTISVQNVNEDKKESFIRIINDAIDDMINNGIDIDKFKAGINHLYFENVEGEYGRYPRGLYLVLVSLETYLYEGDPGTYIEYKNAFDYINSIDLNDKNNIFVKKLKEVFIDNKHKCINILRPKQGYSLEKEKQLEIELDERKAKMSKEELEKVAFELKELKEYQSIEDTAEDLKCIPMLDVNDIDKTKKVIDYKLESNENVDCITSLYNDKDVVYIDLSFDITDYTKEEKYLFSLAGGLVSKIDLKTMSFHEFNNYVDLKTGGFAIRLDILEEKILFTFGIKVTKDNVAYAFDAIFKLLTETKFVDTKRIALLMNEHKSSSLLSLLSAGHAAAITRSKSNIEFSSSMADKVGANGVAFNRLINAVCKEYEKNCDLINDTFDLLYKKIETRKMYLCTCVNEKYYEIVKNEFKTFSNKLVNEKFKYLFTDKDEKRLEANILEIKKFIPFETFEKKSAKEAIITPNDVNFCAKSGTFDKNEYSGRLSVLKTLFNYEYLWTNIRVLGGAYGCMSAFAKTGTFAFVSYRDPNVSNTNKVFDGVEDFLKEIKKGDDEIKKYIIGTMGSIDRPLSIVERYKANVAAYFNGDNDKEYNKFRQEALNMKGKDFNELASIFANAKNINKCALICASKIEEAKKEYDDVWQLMD